jgi:predicted RND superfamily exporter protein
MWPMLARCLHFFDRHHRWISILVVAVLAAGAYFALRLEILDSPERWMPATTRNAWLQFEKHFDAGDNIGVGLHFDRPITDDDQEHLERLRRRFEAIDGMARVYDPSLVAEYIERVPLTEMLDPRNHERFALYSGALWDEPDPGTPRRTLMMVLELEYNRGEFGDKAAALNARRRRVAQQIERIVAEEIARPEWQQVDFHVAGSVTIMHELERRTRHVGATFLPVSIAVGLAALFLSFRSLRALAIAVAGSGVAMLLLLGWLGATGGTLGVVTVAAPALIAVIGAASTMHFASYAADFGSTGQQRHRNHFIRWVAVPCLGAAATTGVGFLMLCFNELIPIRELGVQMCLGSLLAFWGVFLVAQWLPIRRARPARWLTHQRLRTFARRTTLRPRQVVVAGLLVMAVLFYAALPRSKDAPVGLHVNADPFSFFADDQPVKRALNHFSQRRFAVWSLEVVMVPKQMGRPPQALEPADECYLRNEEAAERFAQLVAQREDLGVLRVFSTLNFRRRYEQFLDEVTSLGHRGSLLGSFLQFGRYATSANFLNYTFQSWSVDHQNSGTLRLTLVAHDTPQGFGPLVRFVRQHLPEDRFDCYLSGTVASSVDLAEGLGLGVGLGLLSSFVVMGGLCCVLFGSVRLAAIAFLPNVFPVLCVFGIMGLFKIPLSSGSAMVSTIAVGIALNDTIHFLLHYRQRTREEGMAIRDAVRETVQGIGRPVILTSLVHIAGFSVFLLTDFVPLYHFGLLSCLAMTAALVGDLVLLPNLLLVLDRVPRPAALPEPEAWPLPQPALDQLAPSTNGQSLGVRHQHDPAARPT